MLLHTKQPHIQQIFHSLYLEILRHLICNQTGGHYQQQLPDKTMAMYYEVGSRLKRFKGFEKCNCKSVLIFQQIFNTEILI